MRELLFSVSKSEFDFQATKGSGKGGQARNKTSSAIRCTHKESGAVGYSEEDRLQGKNKEIAFKKCVDTPEFQAWLKLKAARINGLEARVEAEVKKQMAPENIKVEVIEDGKWSVT